MSTTIGSIRRIPGKMKSKTLSVSSHEQLLAVAEKIIDASAEPLIVKKYYRLKQKMLGGELMGTPSISIQATPQKLSSTIKTANKSRNTTTVKKNGQSPPTAERDRYDKHQNSEKKARSKSTQLLRFKADRPKERSDEPAATKPVKEISNTTPLLVELCEAVCGDLNSLRDKILRKEYSRQKLKQVQPRARQILQQSQHYRAAAIDSKLEAYEVAFDKVALALDVVSMQVKEDIVKAYNSKSAQQPEGERMKQDNVWLLDKVERLLNENYALRSRLIGNDLNEACEEVRKEISQKPN